MDINDFLRNEMNNAVQNGTFKNIKELADKAGVPQSNCSDFITGKRAGFTFATAYKILNALGFTLEKNSFSENKTTATIQRLGAYSPIKKIHEDDEGLLKIDIYQVTGAGNPFVLRENEPITSIFVSELYARQADIAFLVDGESMYPTIKNNAIVGVSLKKDFQPNEVFAINHPAGGVTIKRISIKGKNWVIRSDNPNKELYPQEDQYSLEEYPNLIIGRVVWVWQSM